MSKPYTIKFSHYYLKMRGFDLERPFTLVAVRFTTGERLTTSFIQYDTTYTERGIDNVFQTYKLPKGDLITLYLVQDFHMMTTVRRYTPEKFSFYASLIGKEVLLKVIQEGVSKGVNE